jgi:surface polysaccharide O-acyltransferase-like enzyme
MSTLPHSANTQLLAPDTQQPRLIYADLLRVLAIISVVIFHIASSQWAYINQASLNWQIMNIYKGLTIFAVPALVMVSGMFLLDPQKHISITKIYRKYTSRIVLAYICWSAIYAIIELLFNPQSTLMASISFFVSNTIYSHYHLWFLLMIAGLYIVTPILRLITLPQHEQLLKYYLGLWVLFGVIFPTFITFPILDKLAKPFADTHLSLVTSFVGYYLLGYFLKTHSLNQIQRRLLYGLGIVSLILAITATTLFAPSHPSLLQLYDYLSPTVLGLSIAIFLAIQSLPQLNKSYIPLLSNLSSLSFGVYLVHDIFIIILSHHHITTLSYNPLISIPSISLVVLLVSFGTSYLLNKIPWIKDLA